MTIKSIIINIFLISISIKCFGQNSNNVIGKVVDHNTGGNIEGVVLNIYKGNVNIFHTSTDSTGMFIIPANLFNTSTCIKLHALNYEEYNITTKYNISEKGNYFLGSFELRPLEYYLKNVEIIASKRYRDTSRIDLSKIQFERSKMIEDLFYRNGLSINNKGQLTYRGSIVANVKVDNKDFFGKNNLDIFKLLPALTIDNIEVVTTNIDSLTNTTSSKPTINVNLNFKEQYKKGNFGNVNSSFGTSNRYLFQGNWFKYKGNEQISIAANSNNVNINDNQFQEPKLNFSSNSNNTTITASKIEYKNVIKDKLFILASFKGSFVDKDYMTSVERQDETAKQYSEISNSSKNRSFSTDGSVIEVSYKPDLLNVVLFKQVLNYNHSDLLDSLRYNIKQENSMSISQMNKQSMLSNNLSSTHIKYDRSFSKKKGRLFTLELKFTIDNLKNKERNDIFILSSNAPINYYINGTRKVKDKTILFSTNFTEPLNESSYLKFFSSYSKNVIKYNSDVQSDTLTMFLKDPIESKYRYLEFGNSYHKTFRKFSFDASINEVVRYSVTENIFKNNSQAISNMNMDIVFNYDINKRKKIAFKYKQYPEYPNINSLTDISSSFGLVSQFNGNPYLKPEIKKRLEILFDIKQSDSLSMSFSGGIEQSLDKFGFVINNSSTSIQTTQIENVGNAKSGDISFNLSRYFSSSSNLNYFMRFSYDELPTIVNNNNVINRGYNLNSSFSFSNSIINSISSQSSTLSTSINKYDYDNISNSILNITLATKLSLNVLKMQASIYPFVNFNKSLKSTTSWAANCDLRKSMFKNYVVCWIQGYDLFNSFKFINNLQGPTFTQTLKYSNINRYILIGISFKFNSMK